MTKNNRPLSRKDLLGIKEAVRRALDTPEGKAYMLKGLAESRALNAQLNKPRPLTIEQLQRRCTI